MSIRLKKYGQNPSIISKIGIILSFLIVIGDFVLKNKNILEELDQENIDQIVINEENNEDEEEEKKEEDVINKKPNNRFQDLEVIK